MSLKRILVSFFLASVLAGQVKARVFTKTLTQSRVRLGQFASCLEPQHLALLARKEFKRPSFWLGIAGATAFIFSEKMKREASQASLDVPLADFEAHEERQKQKFKKKSSSQATSFGNTLYSRGSSL